METPASGSAMFHSQHPVHMLKGELSAAGALPERARVVFSYARPDVLRQAKLEAMEFKIRLRMAQAKAASGDHTALKALAGGKTLDLKALACSAGPGSKEQLKALVVPPQFTPCGDEIHGTSKVILSGERRDYMHVETRAAAAVREPAYRTTDAHYGATLSEADAQKGKKAWVQPNQKQEKPLVQPDPLFAKLQQGMLTYVPIRTQNPPDGVARNAFVSQAQAIEEARAEYDMQRPPGRHSALRHCASVRAHDHAGPSTPPLRTSASGRVSGSGMAPFGESYGNDKLRDVPMVRVQEVDLFSLYRARPSRGRQPQQPSSPKLTDPISPRPLRATVQSSSTKKTVTLATNLAQDMEFGMQQSSQPSSQRASLSGYGVQQQQHQQHARASSSGAAAASGRASPVPTRSSLSGARASEAAAAAMHRSLDGAHVPWPHGTGAYHALGLVLGARSLSGPGAGAQARPVVGPAAPSSGAGGLLHGPNGKPPRSLSISSRAPGRTAGSSSGSTTTAGPAAHCVPQAPGARRRQQQQQRPGSAVPTAKTNSRVRSGLMAERSTPSQQADEPSCGGGGAADRVQLQQRVLEYTARQYVQLKSEESATHCGGADHASGGWPGAHSPSPAETLLGSSWMTTNRSAYLPSNAFTSGGDPAATGRQRPQSAPSKRIRPPSAGAWAGRPQPEAVASATVQRSLTGMVYDPAVNGSPLDRLYPEDPGY